MHQTKKPSLLLVGIRQYHASIAYRAECWLRSTPGSNMKLSRNSSIEAFSVEFARAYWQTVKERKFPMPPDEPVPETLDELLAAVSISFATNQADTIVMTSTNGAWWEFSFRHAASAWIIDSARAESLSPTSHHHLLRKPFDQYFRPFLEYVTHNANNNLSKKNRLLKR